MPISDIEQYVPRFTGEVDRRNLERRMYPVPFIAGSDVYVSIGSHALIEVNAINCVITENVLPIYGVWSRKFDRVAVGTLTIGGMFVINFTRPHYLLELLQIENSMPSEKQPSANLISSVPSPESEIDSETLAAAIQQDPDQFNAMADAQDEQYGQETQNELFDRFQMGDNRSVFYNEHGRIKPTSLSIIYRPPESSGEKDPQTGAKIFEGVHITSCRQLVDMSGKPVFEEYQFIARDIKFAEDGVPYTLETTPQPDDAQ